MKTLKTIQGWYYIITGIWPSLHLGSFEMVTGAKTDGWLVQMVGLLACSIGITLLLRPQRILAFLTALSFLWIDVRYFYGGTISAVYLLDGFVQMIFLIWILMLSQKEEIRYFSRRRNPM